MGRARDVRAVGAALYFQPIRMRVPLKFGTEVLDSVTCVRASLTVTDRQGRTATGWGETPLSVQWVWPSRRSHAERHEALTQLCETLTGAWPEFGEFGHPIEVGHAFQRDVLPGLLSAANRNREEPIPWLGALVCCAPFDLALHDAYGILHGRPVYTTYGPAFMNHDLGYYLEPAAVSDVRFTGKYPEDFLLADPPRRLPAWHLVGGLDPLDPGDLTGDEPDDGYPVVLSDWLDRDGLRCLKIKLRGTDAAWDYDRIVRVGALGQAHGADWLSLDFNCTVIDPAYVTEILDRLMREHPPVYGMVLYVEQPFPYELEAHRIDVHSVSARKPLFMDESAHNWHLVRVGRELGWSGVALKTCKTQTEALLTLCWARAHGMTLMVQDLTNPMLAQVSHALLAAHADTLMGVETNAPQFYPDASGPEAEVHPGLYRRREGMIDLSTVSGPGFGYRVGEINRELHPPVVVSPP